MSQGVPTGLEGQIESPNSLELWWDKNKRLFLLLGLAAVAAIAINYGVKYANRKAENERYSRLMQVTGLDQAYLDVEDSAGVDPQQIFFKYSQRLQRLGSGSLEDVKNVDGAALEAALKDYAGDDVMEPVLMWTAANRARGLEEFAEAKKILSELSTKHPKHFLNLTSDSPPQWQPEVEKDEDEDEAKTPNPRRKPDLVDPVSGSPVAMLMARLDREIAFRAAHPQFYEAPEPDSDKVAVFKLKTEGGDDFDGVLKIRFYAAKAPKHYAAFLAAIERGFFDQLAIHEVERKPEDQFAALAKSHLKFGLAITKDEADTSKWTEASTTVAEENSVPFEESGVSHFPFMVAADVLRGSTDFTSQVERIVINAEDLGDTQDGRRVVFGRVIEGMDLVERIISDVGFSSETAAKTGRGVPDDRIRIESVTIETL